MLLRRKDSRPRVFPNTIAYEARREMKVAMQTDVTVAMMLFRVQVRNGHWENTAPMFESVGWEGGPTGSRV